MRGILRSLLGVGRSQGVEVPFWKGGFRKTGLERPDEVLVRWLRPAGGLGGVGCFGRVAA